MIERKRKKENKKKEEEEKERKMISMDFYSVAHLKAHQSAQTQVPQDPHVSLLSSRDGNGYKPAGFCYPKPVPMKNIYTH
jgi:hypothetical protein